MTKRRYTEEFKIEAVKQVIDRGHKPRDVAKRLGLAASSITEWLKKYGTSNNNQHQLLTSQQQELRRLKAELYRVTEERNILKEAAAFFASESKKNTRS